jgi:hypothetical protein
MPLLGTSVNKGKKKGQRYGTLSYPIARAPSRARFRGKAKAGATSGPRLDTCGLLGTAKGKGRCWRRPRGARR